MRTEKVMLAGAEYVIRELPMKRNAEWRQRASDEVAAYTDLLSSTQAIKSADTSGVLALVRKAGEMIFHAPDTVVELLFEYAPDLRVVDLDNVYESELMEAFSACLRLAFPFGKMTSVLMSLAERGSAETVSEPTSTNSGSESTQTPDG